MVPSNAVETLPADGPGALAADLRLGDESDGAGLVSGGVMRAGTWGAGGSKAVLRLTYCVQRATYVDA
jgi:hypothetical protein